MLAEGLTSTQTASAPAAAEPGLRLVTLAARMLLEYDVRSSILAAQVQRLGQHVGVHVQPLVAYRSVALHLDDGRCICVRTPEYRINVAVGSGVLRLIDQTCAGRISPREAIERMQSLEHRGACHSPWALPLMFALAASALACILQADFGAAAVSGVSSAIGLVTRRALARRHWPLLSLPFF